MGRASAERLNEECWPLTGERRGRIWYARRWTRCVGQPSEVEFDAAAVLAREERRRDVVGFLHTHPNAPARPSRRDVQTMQAWVSCFGKPLLCVIDGADGMVAFRFDSDDATGERLPVAESFQRGIVIAMDVDL